MNILRASLVVLVAFALLAALRSTDFRFRVKKPARPPQAAGRLGD